MLILFMFSWYCCTHAQSQEIRELNTGDHALLDRIKINERNAAVDKEGNRWVTTNKGLYKKNNGIITRIDLPFRFKCIDSSADDMHEVLADGNGLLWITTNGFLYSLDPMTLQFSQIKLPCMCKGAFINREGQLLIWGKSEGDEFVMFTHVKTTASFRKIASIGYVDTYDVRQSYVPQPGDATISHTVSSHVVDEPATREDPFPEFFKRACFWGEYLEGPVYFYYKKNRFECSVIDQKITGSGLINTGSQEAFVEHVFSTVIQYNRSLASDSVNLRHIRQWIHYKIMSRQFSAGNALSLNDTMFVLTYYDALATYSTATGKITIIQDLFLPDSDSACNFQNSLTLGEGNTVIAKIMGKTYQFYPQTNRCIEIKNVRSAWQRDYVTETNKVSFGWDSILFTLDSISVTRKNLRSNKQDSILFSDIEVFDGYNQPRAWTNVDLKAGYTKVFASNVNKLWIVRPGTSISELDFEHRPVLISNPIRNYLGGGDTIVSILAMGEDCYYLLTTNGIYYSKLGFIRKQFLLPASYDWRFFTLVKSKRAPNSRLYAIGPDIFLEIRLDLLTDNYQVPFSYHLDSVYVNGIRLDKFEDENTFTYEKNSFSFFITYSSLIKGAEYSLYELDGRESKFTKPVTGKRIDLLPLIPGRYVLSIRAANDTYYNNPTIFQFTVLPPFWKTRWFNLILVCIAVSIGVYYYGMKLAAVKQKENVKTQLAEYEKKQAHLSLALLRSQINPHFLSNCLASIRNQVVKNQNREAENYLAQFSSFLRLVLQYSDKNKISLEKEEAVTKLYLEMERMLNKNINYRFRMNVDKYSIEVPPLLLQPIVENAIKHGLSSKEDGGMIDIEATMLSDELLEITIRDNGIGREQSSAFNKRQLKLEESFGSRLTKKRIELQNHSSGVKYSNGLTSYEIIDLKDHQGNPSGTLVILKIAI